MDTGTYTKDLLTWCSWYKLGHRSPSVYRNTYPDRKYSGSGNCSEFPGKDWNEKKEYRRSGHDRDPGVPSNFRRKTWVGLWYTESLNVESQGRISETRTEKSPSIEGIDKESHPPHWNDKEGSTTVDLHLQGTTVIRRYTIDYEGHPLGYLQRKTVTEWTERSLVDLWG